MRTLKLGQDKKYLEFKKDTDNKIQLEVVVDKMKTIFNLEKEELEIVYRYMIGDDYGTTEE